MRQVQNKHLRIEPIRQGMMSVEGNEYKVIDAPLYGMDGTKEVFVFYAPGDIVVVEDTYVIRVLVQGKETFFVQEENVLERITPDVEPAKDCGGLST